MTKKRQHKSAIRKIPVPIKTAIVTGIFTIIVALISLVIPKVKSDTKETLPIKNKVTISPVFNNDMTSKIEKDTVIIKDTLIVKEKSKPINQDEKRFYEMLNIFLEKYSGTDLAFEPQYDSLKLERYNKANKYFEALRMQAKKAGIYKDYKSFFLRFGQVGSVRYSEQQLDSMKDAALATLIAKHTLKY